MKTVLQLCMTLFFSFFISQIMESLQCISQNLNQLLDSWRNIYFCHLLCAAVHVSPTLHTNNLTWYPLGLQLLTSLKLLIFIASFKKFISFYRPAYYFLTFEKKRYFLQHKKNSLMILIKEKSHLSFFFCFSDVETFIVFISLFHYGTSWQL